MIEQKKEILDFREMEHARRVLRDITKMSTMLLSIGIGISIAFVALAIFMWIDAPYVTDSLLGGVVISALMALLGIMMTLCSQSTKLIISKKNSRVRYSEKRGRTQSQRP